LSIRFKASVAALVVLTLVAGCGKTAPAATVMPPAHTPALATHTPVPAMATEDPYRYVIPGQTGDGWETGALEAVGFDKDPFVSLMNKLNELDGDGINGILVARDGKLVFEAYLSGFSYYYNAHVEFDRDTLHHLQSVTKSITSILVGIAIERGFIDSVQENLFDFFPQYAHLVDAYKGRITLEHALTMSAGFLWDEGAYPFESRRNDLGAMSRSDDYVGYLLSKPVINEPGSVHVYNSGLPIVLGVVIEKTSALYADEFAEQYLFAPLGIQDYYWYPWHDLHPHTGGGLYLRPRDLLKIGQMVLSGGLWQGKRVVSSEWIERSTSPIITVTLPGRSERDAQKYGYYWWRDTLYHNSTALPTIQALGAGGQALVLIPDFDVVIAFTGSNYDRDPQLGTTRIVELYILPALQP
jgi:CubicO group peptidase (beta-lactamase class C family)